MNQKNYRKRSCVRFLSAARIGLSMALVLVLLGGCSTKKNEQPSTTDNKQQTDSQNPQTDSQDPKTDAEPTTLEQELLSKRNIAFEASDYKTFVGGEGLLNFDTVFADVDPAAAKGDLSSIFLAGGKIYKFRCDMTLPGGQNCIETGTLPVSSKAIYLHSSDFNGADIDVIFEGERRFGLEAPTNNGPYIADESKYGMIYFEHTYQYSSDGKSLNELTNFRSTISRFDSHLMIADGKLYAYANRQVKDDFFDEPLYYDDKDHGFIIWEVNCSGMSENEKIITMFNGNILVTDQAFYKIVYDDVPDSLTDYSQKVTNSDGTAAEYLPKFGGGDRYRLEKIELLTKYYDEVATITQSYVITKDYKILPITEIIPAENKYSQYQCGDIEIPEDVSQKIN